MWQNNKNGYYLNAARNKANRFFDFKTRKLYHARLMTAQHIIDSLEFARKSQEFYAIIPVSAFSRLQDVLYSSDGYLDCRVQGVVNVDGKPRLLLNVDGVLELKCGRCLGAIKHPLRVQMQYVLVEHESVLSEDAIELTDDEDLLLAQNNLDVYQVIEDEVLLALPYALMHENAICNSNTQVVVAEKPNPFSVLRGLKLNSGESSEND